MITEQLLGVGRKSKTSRPKCTGNDGDGLKVYTTQNHFNCFSLYRAGLR